MTTDRRTSLIHGFSSSSSSSSCARLKWMNGESTIALALAGLVVVLLVEYLYDTARHRTIQIYCKVTVDGGTDNELLAH